MIKILEAINEPPKNFDDLINSLYNIQMEDVVITDVDIEPKSNEHVKHEFMISFHLKVTRLTPDTINIFYPKVVEVLKNKGYGPILWSFSVRIGHVVFTHPSGFSMDWTKFIPVHIINNMKYGDPTLEEIDKGQYSLVLPKNPVTDNPEDLNNIIKSKRKSAQVYYKVYQKGELVGHKYTLSDNPEITVSYLGGFRTELQMRSFKPYIVTYFESIDDIPVTDKEFPRHLGVHISEALSLKFKKHDINFTSYAD
jgi:hypothetical protein